VPASPSDCTSNLKYCEMGERMVKHGRKAKAEEEVHKDNKKTLLCSG